MSAPKCPECGSTDIHAKAVVWFMFEDGTSVQGDWDAEFDGDLSAQCQTCMHQGTNDEFGVTQ